MKILHVIYSLVPGGAERFVVDISNELAENNEVLLYTLRDDSLEDHSFYLPFLSSKVKYTNLKIRPGFKPGLIWLFYKILRKEKPDVVHCHLNLVNYFFFSSLILHRKIKFIYTLHNAAATEVLSGTERLIRKFFFKHRFFIPVAISHETKKSYQEYYKLNEVDVIYNGRKYEGKSIEYENVEREINSFKPGKNTLVFCHASRYDKKQKNQVMLIRAFNRLYEEGYDIILIIVGGGFENTFELKDIAKEHIHFLGIKNNVNDYLFASDSFCLSSSYEGMPIALLEAFACGCIPVCTPVGGIADIVKNGETGFLSRSTDEEDYLDALKQFIEHRHMIIKDNLINAFKENYSIEKCADSYMKVYKG